MALIWALVLPLLFGQAFPFPAETSSLVVSSTEAPKEAAATTSDANNKEDSTPIVPKIYELKVDTNVSNRFATTLVTSKVKNLGATAQEATFSVVLPETAYISGFIMEIGGKSYEAYVKEKEEAKQIYTEAVESGQAAAHVEASARDSNRFTVSVNVEPQSKATFKLTYEELLQRQKEQYEVVINIHPGQPVKDLTVEVHINETRPLKFVKSPSLRSGNEIGKNDDKLASLADIDIINQTSANVKFSPNIERQKQLATGLGTKEENGLSGQFVVQYDVERDPQGGEVLVKDGYFVHFFAPSDLTPLPKYVVFVLDTSGSMQGTRIQQLKEAMNSILSELKKEDAFSIVEFSSTVRVWNVLDVAVQYEEGSDPWALHIHKQEKSAPANETKKTLPAAVSVDEDTIAKAKEVVEELSAFGGTDIKNALEVGLKLVKKLKEQPDAKQQPLIIFLTDGEPTVGESNVDKIVTSISEINSGSIRTPIFSLSFGDGADRDFLQRISLRNLGFARHIYEGADASLQLQEFYKQISSPLLSNVSFKYVSNVTKLTQTEFPIFFHGSELVVAGKAPIAIDRSIFEGLVYGDGLVGQIRLVPKVEHPLGALERLWAYLTVKQILEARDAAENKTSFTKKALDLALKYSFVTPVSSLVVVKPNATKAVNTEDASKSADVPYYLNKFAPTTGHRGPALSLPQSPVYFAAGAPIGMLGGARPGGSYYSGSAAFPPMYITTPSAENALIAEPPLDIRFETDAEEDAVDSYSDIKTKLPWLSAILRENGTLTSPPGDYKLSINETVSVAPECPKTPINGTAGICTLLPQCPQVFSLLTDEKIFVEYFCPLDSFVGICCPTTATSPAP